MIYILLIALLLSTMLNIFLIISLKKTFNQIDLLENWLVDFKLLINNTYNKLKSIDNRGIFEKDDDVGVLFTDLLNIIKLTNTRIQNDDTAESTDFNEKNKPEIL